MFKRAMTDLSKLSESELRKFLDSFDTIATDCDGVLWISGKAIQGAAEVLDKFRQFGKKIFFVTNNSMKTRDELVQMATKLGFHVEKDEVISTSYLTACYLKSINFEGKAYVIGSRGITQELDEIKVKHTGVGPDVVTTLQESLNFVIDPEVRAVIVGMDHDFSYGKMLKAATYLNNPEVAFIGTNTDERFPTTGWKVCPGTGALLRSIECCSLRKAMIMGKPSDFVGKALIQEKGINPARTLMIGDRLNTDIAFASRCGFQSLLVLSGVTTLAEVQELKKSKLENLEHVDENKLSEEEKERQEQIPDYYLESLGYFLKIFNK